MNRRAAVTVVLSALMLVRFAFRSSVRRVAVGAAVFGAAWCCVVLGQGGVAAGKLSVKAAAGGAAGRPWMNPLLGPEQRARLLLAQMTLTEKVDLMTGNQGQAPFAYYNAPIPRLGIPALKMADSTAGVAPRGWTLPGTGAAATAMPQPIALAASWSLPLVAQYARTVTNEVLETGQNVLLGPDSDVVRTPWWGRVNETMGEDPILNSEMNALYTRVVQSKQVIATLKHYVAYNQETNRGTGMNDIIALRSLREVYTLMYEAVDRWADPGAAMCSFNRINGAYSCENARTLRDLLKRTLGFTGFVLTDFGAIHTTLDALLGGTDMETGTTTVYGGALQAAVEAKRARLALVNGACLRILTTMFRLGIFDHGDYAASAIPVAEHDAVARRAEEQAITLLADRDHTLPLGAATKSITLVGADANVIAAPSGAPFVLPTRSTPVLNGVMTQAHASGATVNWVPGNDPVNGAVMLEGRDMTTVPSSVLSPTHGVGTGLTSYYWHNPAFQGRPAVIRTDQQVNYDVGFLSTFGLWAGKTSQVPLPPAPVSATEQQSVVYDGHITAPRTGDYTLALTGWGDATLSIDGQQLVSAVGPPSACHPNGGGGYGGGGGAAACRFTAATPALHWVAGQSHTLHITYQADRPLNGLEPGTLLLEWKTPAGAYSPAIQQAADAARKTGIAIVFVRTYESEQRDRVSLHLPQSADQLIAAVRAANPHTIVVLANNGPVTMPWLRSVAAVVETYFGGQEQGAALARVLWGEVDPSGKLTVTYPTSDTAIPPGVTNPWATAGDLNVVYGEGINVGYKGYDRAGITPLFPFGYGLSYTAYKYSGLGITRTGNAKAAPTRVHFRVTNTGSRSGAEIAEVYLRLPQSTGEPPKRLVAFTKVNIAPGQSAEISLSIEPSAPTHPLGYFNTDRSNWEIAPGTYSVYVGGSERNTPLTATFTVS